MFLILYFGEQTENRKQKKNINHRVFLYGSHFEYFIKLGGLIESKGSGFNPLVKLSVLFQ